MFKIFEYLLTTIMILGLVLGCGGRMTKEQYYAQAENYEKEEKFEDALKSYEKIVKKFPDSDLADQAQYKIAYIYSNNLNDFEKSVTAHKALIEKYAESKYAVQSLFMIGFIYANNINDYDKAREYYNKFIEKYPDSELISSVQWELDHLGQDINEIDFLKQESEEKAQ